MSGHHYLIMNITALSEKITRRVGVLFSSGVVTTWLADADQEDQMRGLTPLHIYLISIKRPELKNKGKVHTFSQKYCSN